MKIAIAAFLVATGQMPEQAVAKQRLRNLGEFDAGVDDMSMVMIAGGPDWTGSAKSAKMTSPKSAKSAKVAKSSRLEGWMGSQITKTYSRAEINAEREKTVEDLIEDAKCFEVIANGVEFNAAAIIQRSARLDTVNEARQCSEFGFFPFDRFGGTYCTGDSFAIGDVRLYDKDATPPSGDTMDEFVAGLCTNYTEPGAVEGGAGYPVKRWVNPCANSNPESYDNEFENARAGYYSRSGVRVARISDGLSAIPPGVGGDQRSVFDVHSMHVFAFPDKGIEGGVVVDGVQSQIVAMSLDGTSNAPTSTTGSATIVGGTGVYTGVKGIVYYDMFRVSSANNSFKICLFKD